MFNFNLTYKWLFFTRPSGPLPPVPDGLKRHFIDTPLGSIEILSAQPSTKAQGPPIFFCHGGMGGAWVWTEYMQYLSARGVPCYAISLRGHGNSWHPSYLRMVYGTTRGALSDDLVAGIRWVQERENSEVVLVGHSSGGGLSQGVLGQGDVSVKGLALLGAVPAYGSTGVYMNWAKLDPWFTIRMLFHFWHPNSPLSHPILTKRAFFCNSYPISSLIQFQRRLNRYESFLWPISMMKPFASASSILKQIHNSGSEKVLVMAGTGDKLMTVPVTKETAAFYREASEGKTESGEGVEKGVRLVFVEGAGHHVQNDVQWEDGAEKLLKFYRNIQA
ncbi:Fc.00g028110.m01.CDS01 [Cosmosporella sp. VM-42]